MIPSSFKIQLRKVKFKLIPILTCGVKTLTLLFWVSIYFLVMKLTIFKSIPENKPTVQRDYLETPDEDTFDAIELVNDGPNYEGTMELKEPENQTEAIMKLRSDQVKKVCMKYSLESQAINSREFFVDYRHHLVWCNIFKAASTMWLYNFNILGGYTKKLISSADQPLILARAKFPPPKPEQLTYAARNPFAITFLIVREPFVRLLSGYRDKIENMTRPYYVKMARAIISKQRDKAVKIFGQIKQRGPTFYEFVADLIEKHKANKSFDEHWSPYYKFCSPCALNFSVIAKVETLERDSAFIIHKLDVIHKQDFGISNLLKQKPRGKRFLRKIINKARDGRNTTQLIEHYYSQLNKSMIEDLLQIYGIDFEMFGYDPEIYRSFVKNKN